MTDEQMQIIANRIRDRWTAERYETPNTANPTTVPPPGFQSAEHIAVLNTLKSHSEWDLTRKQRGRLRRLEYQLRNPDMSGLSGPEDDDFKEFPHLRELVTPHPILNTKR